MLQNQKCIKFVYDCENTKRKEKIGISKNSEKRSRQISWEKEEKENKQRKKQNA